MADEFEIIAVDEAGSTDHTAGIADRLASSTPVGSASSTIPSTADYGAALRSGFAAASYPLIAFTDGGPPVSRVADLSRLSGTARRPRTSPTSWSALGCARADPTIRLVYARAYRFCLATLLRLP
jgi:hypothetical protein